MKIERNIQGKELENFLNLLKKNDGYCPCSIQHIPETKCMCKEFREQKEGKCHCGLYIKYPD